MFLRRTNGRSVKAEVRDLLTNAQEAERLRISRALHDELGQNLALLKLKLTASEERQNSELLSIVDDTIERLRRVAFEIRPLLLDELGLAHALQKKLTDLQTSSGLRCGLYVPAGFELGAPFDLGLYRIAQESLNNVVRHAGATEVSVVLQRRSRTIHLEVRDNGRGIQARDRLKHGLGLGSMKERAQIMGGRLSVDTHPGGGTIVRVEVPLPRGAAE